MNLRHFVNIPLVLFLWICNGNHCTWSLLLRWTCVLQSRRFLSCRLASRGLFWHQNPFCYNRNLNHLPVTSLFDVVVEVNIVFICDTWRDLCVHLHLHGVTCNMLLDYCNTACSLAPFVLFCFVLVPAWRAQSEQSGKQCCRAAVSRQSERVREPRSNDRWGKLGE